jgi:Sec-independent protein secretion pathway component TatC
MSAFIVLIPLAVLYEASVWLSGFVYRRSAARMNAGSLQPYG